MIADPAQQAAMRELQDVTFAQAQLASIRDQIASVNLGGLPFDNLSDRSQTSFKDRDKSVPKGQQTSSKFDAKKDKKWEAFKQKMERQTGENFDELAEERLSAREVGNNLLSMMGELEPNVPSTRREKEKR